jgi:23S rRNA A1618 N6-methylase RlmF
MRTWLAPHWSSELSRVLLKEYFQLTVDMPADQLIPTVNSRLSYVRWIASLLEMGRPSGHPPDVRGIDMYGNGPSQLPRSPQ